MVTVHNGGGAGIDSSQSCGYGLLIDGSDEVDEIIKRAVNYDIMCGVARIAWARKENSMRTVIDHNDDTDCITLPYICSDETIIGSIK